MPRALTLAVLATALLATSGCQTSRKIASRIELANLAAKRPVTVYGQDRQVYKLRDHALVDSVIRGAGTVSSGGRTTRFEGTIPLTSIHAIQTNSKNLMKGLVLAGVTVMFVQGCGGDLMCSPRGTVALCRKYGEQLAGGVDKALDGPLVPVRGPLRTAFEVVPLGPLRP